MSTHSNKARETILSRLRSGTGDGGALFRSQDDSEFLEGIPSAVTNAEGSGIALVRTFGENLESVLGSYEIVEDIARVPERIMARIGQWRSEKGSESYGAQMLSWPPEELPIPDLGTELERLGVSLYVPSDLHNREERARASSLPIGLTGVDAAFAGTGSMVFIPSSGKSRAASLLPLHHIALVPISRIFPIIESWLAELRSSEELEGLFRNNSQLVFVTGPSKSADIELNLTLGVHGPKDVHAIILDDSSS